VQVQLGKAAGDLNGRRVNALEALKLLVFKEGLLVWVALASTVEGAVAIAVTVNAVCAIWAAVGAVVAVVAVELAWTVVKLAWSAVVSGRT
jgi:hypothetical protein